MKIGWTAKGRALHKQRMFQSLALAGMIIAAAPGSAGGIAGVDVRDDDVVVRFDGRVDGASAFLLDAPRRIALDIDGAQMGRFQFAPGRGNIASVRQGQLSNGTARRVHKKGPVRLTAMVCAQSPS